jgi:plastocyanin
MRSLACALILLAACGDDGGGMAMPDAPKSIDAPSATVTEVDCATVTPAATVTTTDASFMFMPMATTISVGQVVKFTTSLSHDVVPNPAAAKTDPGITVGFGKTACLKFSATGTFGFMCMPHGFVGTVTVN